MRKWACIWVATTLALTAASGAIGQFMPGSNAGNTLTIMVTGTATAPADWVDVNLGVKSEGVNLQEAFAKATMVCEDTITELMALGIAEENFRIGAPSLAAADLTQIMVGAAGGAPAEPMPSVARSLTVRFTIADRETLWEDVFRIVDVATGEGATPGGAGGNPYMPQMMASGELLTFGVDDTEALRTQAVANGLQEAKKQADLAAASTGKSVKGLSAVGVMEYDANPMMAAVTIATAKPATGQTNSQISLSVTYELE